MSLREPDGTPIAVQVYRPQMHAWLRRVGVVLRELTFFVLGIFLGPLALSIDLVRFGRRLGKSWILGYLVATLAVTSAAWGTKYLIEEARRPAVDLLSSYSLETRSPVEVPFADTVIMHSVRNGLDPALVAAVIRKESRFDPNAVSPDGARGLMQITPSTWRYLRPDSPCSGEHPPPSCGSDCIFDVDANVRAGTRYLRMLLDEFDGDAVLAFAAYNAGPTAVRRYSTMRSASVVPPYVETREFVMDVLRNWLSFRRSPPPLDIDPARMEVLDRLDELLPWVALGYWGLVFLWSTAKVPWK